MMSCQKCGRVAASDVAFCPFCKVALIKPVGQETSGASPIWVALILGGLVGAFIGFLLRPSAPLIGQLPFGTVITRGGDLTGFDRILVSVAQASFNYMVAGLVLGGIVGAGVGAYLSKREPEASPESWKEIQPTPPRSVELGQTPEQVEATLGPPDKKINLGSKVVYIYKDVKIIFLDNKVNDVQ